MAELMSPIWLPPAAKSEARKCRAGGVFALAEPDVPADELSGVVVSVPDVVPDVLLVVLPDVLLDGDAPDAVTFDVDEVALAVEVEAELESSPSIELASLPEVKTVF